MNERRFIGKGIEADQIRFEHREAECQFVLRVAEFMGMIEYEQLQPNHLDLYYLDVDAELEGTGMAGQLVKQTLEYCRQRKWQITPTCTYIVNYLKRHPEFQDLVA